MKIIGHRGARGLAPENTLPSFQQALTHNVDQLEFDLRVTKDGVVVLNHDRYITGVTGKRFNLSDCSFDELRTYAPNLLRFEDFLAAMDFTVHLLIEIKPREPTEQIIATIKAQLEAGRPVTNLSIGSFDQSILRTMHAAFPEIEMVVIERWSGVRAGFRARQVHTKRLNMRSWWLWKGFLHSMQRSGYQIAPYTMNDPAKAQRWERYIYGVITDFPDRFEK
jgi:glycerophosphoryl diester phosphodiesterase